MEYEGGMMSTWNKFCFTGGLLEASVVLPGDTVTACVTCLSFALLLILTPSQWSMACFVRMSSIERRSLSHMCFEVGQWATLDEQDTVPLWTEHGLTRTMLVTLAQSRIKRKMVCLSRELLSDIMCLIGFLTRYMKGYREWR